MRLLERTGPFEYGILEETDIAEVIDLVNLIHSHAHWTEEYFHWQFRACPAGDAEIVLARSGGQLVCLLGTVPATLDIDGTTAPCGRMQDVMTHPDWRGQGLLHAIGAICRRRFVERKMTGYGFPNERSERGFMRLGWDFSRRVPWWRCSAGTDADVPDETAAARFAMYDERVTAIWDSTGIDLAVRRDAPYLNWRYARPGHTYEKMILEDETVLVLKQYQSTVHVCDVFAPARSPGAIGRALRFARRWAAAHGAETVTAWLPREHPWAAQFADAGMEWEPAVPRIILTLPSPAASAAFSTSPFYVTHSDNDIY